MRYTPIIATKVNMTEAFSLQLTADSDCSEPSTLKMIVCSVGIKDKAIVNNLFCTQNIKNIEIN